MWTTFSAHVASMESEMNETRLIHGFHAVTAKLRHAADDVREITVAEGRQDGRMRDLLKLAEAHGVRVILADAKRLDGLAGGTTAWISVILERPT